MPIYSKNISLFIQEAEKATKMILQDEAGLMVRGGRFNNFNNTASYPISIVVYNDRKELGYFDPNFYEIGLHECLMQVKKEQLHNILRHELAHYLTYIIHPFAASHGPEFLSVCKSLGWGDNVYRARTTLQIDLNTSNREDSPLFRKIHKLLALTSSSNTHEAELAMLKAQELLLKHNIDPEQISSLRDSTEKIIIRRILQSKKRSAKLTAIAIILKTFFVNIIYRSSQEYTYLEISGSATNVDIADYVANFLEHELEKLWNLVQKAHPQLKGLIAKNSFFSGVATGYCNKVEALKKELSKELSSALVLVENNLEKMKELLYPRLSTTKSQRKNCQDSSNLGQQMGENLQINPALQSSKGKETLLIK